MSIVPDIEVARKSQTETGENPGGHKLLCPKCGTFQIHRAKMDDDLALRLTCLACLARGEKGKEAYSRFVLKAGLWIPEELVPRLDEWADKMKEAMMKRVLNPAPPTPLQEKHSRFSILGKRIIGKQTKEEATDAKSTQPEGPSEEDSKPKPEPEPDVDLSKIRTFPDAMEASGGDFEKAAKLLNKAFAARKAKK